MKNHLSTKIQGFLFIIVCIGLMFELAACSIEKTNPAAAVSPVQNSLELSPTGTPVIQHPVESTGTPVPDIASLPTADNGALKNEKSTEILTPEPLFKIGSTQVSPKDGMVMVYVSQGTFEMGIDKYVHLTPGHTVYLDSYWIDKTDVTNAMYAKCVESGSCGEIHSQKNVDTVFKGANQPVVFVNWNDANDYCRW
ncbi:MAG TPA: SUMF1/EgtB/PvdO family nonheme iron enzyme, partial [Leptolinea sp.]